MKDLQKGRPFVEVMGDFLSWCGEDYIFCTWGPLDLYELQRNMRYYCMEPLAGKPIRFLDVQKLFSLEVMKDKTRKTLEFAIDYFEIEKDIPFHRAFSDAYYTARILERIDNPEIIRRDGVPFNARGIVPCLVELPAADVGEKANQDGGQDPPRG